MTVSAGDMLNSGSADADLAEPRRKERRLRNDVTRWAAASLSVHSNCARQGNSVGNVLLNLL